MGAIAAVFASLSGCTPPAQTQVAEAGESPHASEVGRYVIVHSPHIEKDTVLLDTVTGKTWTQVRFGDLTDEPAAWEPMARSDYVDEMDELRRKYPPKVTR